MFLRRLLRQVTPEPLLQWKARAELGAYAERYVVPDPITKPEKRFVPTCEIGHSGFELYPGEQLARLAHWQSYQPLFEALRANNTINTSMDGYDYDHSQALHNGYFPTPDAEAYAAMILDLQPSRIIEIGAGYSTLIARAAISYGNLTTRLLVIDPSPRTDVQRAADTMMSTTVENVIPSKVEIQADDFLFIDSSHICRARGDVTYLFCRWIPELPGGAVVHVHDVFLPYHYPASYDRFCWNEQYLLHSLLQSSRYRTLFSSHWMSRTHGDLMRKTFGPLAGMANQLFCGASYWFQVASPVPIESCCVDSNLAGS
jgi:hypothetical protein